MIDRPVLDWVVEHRTDWATEVLGTVSNVGGTIGLDIAATLLTVVLLVRGRARDALLVAGSMTSGWLVMSLLKIVIGRQRPPPQTRLVQESTLSMPSGHAMMSMVLACVCVALVFGSVRSTVWRSVLTALLLGATAIDGMSRIYLGVHWATDVLLGWILGALWACGWVALLRRWPMLPNRRRSADSYA